MQHEQNEEVHQANGHANGFPYGIDPRQFGLNKLEYERALEHHRQMEHHNIMTEKHEDWRIEQQRTIEETRYHAARNKDREWWLEPLNAFFSVAGVCFWIVAWGYVVLTVLLTLSEWSAQRDAKWCLKDVAKCEAIAKGDVK